MEWQLLQKNQPSPPKKRVVTPPSPEPVIEEETIPDKEEAILPKVDWKETPLYLRIKEFGSVKI